MYIFNEMCAKFGIPLNQAKFLDLCTSLTYLIMAIDIVSQAVRIFQEKMADLRIIFTNLPKSEQKNSLRETQSLLEKLNFVSSKRKQNVQ